LANDLGKRYECKNCGTQVLCTKKGDGEVKCCGVPMDRLEPKPLPAAD
jgi:hypothetical protein